jgi:hypothetical protein
MTRIIVNNIDFSNSQTPGSYIPFDTAQRGVIIGVDGDFSPSHTGQLIINEPNGIYINVNSTTGAAGVFQVGNLTNFVGPINLYADSAAGIININSGAINITSTNLGLNISTKTFAGATWDLSLGGGLTFKDISGAGSGFNIIFGTSPINIQTSASGLGILIQDTANGTVNLRSNVGALNIASYGGGIVNISSNNGAINIFNASSSPAFTNGIEIYNTAPSGMLIYDNSINGFTIQKSNIGNLSILQTSNGLLSMIQNGNGNLSLIHGTNNGTIIIQNNAISSGGITIYNATSGNILISNLAINSLIHLNSNIIQFTGGEIHSYITINNTNSPYTVISEYIILANTSSGNVIINLPTAVSSTGRICKFKNIGTGILTLTPNGTDTIDGNTTISIAQNEVITILSDGTTWWILQ